MNSPTRQTRLFFKRIHIAFLRYSQGNLARSCVSILFVLIAVCFALSFAAWFWSTLGFDALAILNLRTLRGAEAPVALFIAIGSAPNNSDLRRAARETWLTWLPDDSSVQYRFFTDAPPSTRTAYAANASMWRAIAHEVSKFDDLVLQPLPSGYGDNEHNSYGRRALYQARWTVDRFANTRFFLRVDDDSFLCVHRLLYELKSAPVSQFFWGRFWCKEGRNRADENFMLFSMDVVRLLSDRDVTGKLLPFDEEVTLGWNFGLWAWVLNLTIFDDQKRLDAQQGYLTDYMHEGRADHLPGDHGLAAQPRPNFCERFMYAHHVPVAAMRRAFAGVKTHFMYRLPVRKPPSVTCRKGQRSFIPGRHSKRLPKIRVEPLDEID